MSDWIKPTYLGITWNGGNTPPTPMVEISARRGRTSYLLQYLLANGYELRAGVHGRRR